MTTNLDSPLLTESEVSDAIDLLGMPVHPVDFEQAVAILLNLARGKNTTYAVTANVDHMVRFSRDHEIRPLYEQADLVVADGMPLIWASKMLGTRLPERVAGSDLFPRLCQEAAKHDLSVFLLGGAPGTADEAARVLTERHAGLRVAGTYCPDYGFENDAAECRRIVESIRQSNPDIVFVGLGSPKQERWIVANREACGAGLCIGVGISFSFVCGDVVRAPRWMQRAGLEWLHRLRQEPRRLAMRYLWDDVGFFWLVAKALGARTWKRVFAAGNLHGPDE
ncbi:MAG: WecB/TagA/CpsF family glycosyltransferase [Planctomycetes bacterium]|nr:WecB/TagA/CpsF family glycosyltransferase [Planctomycetota bacterium]